MRGLFVLYDKPPLTFDQQINLLKSRGMTVPDHHRAARYLAHINYYRLRAYWLPFEEPDSSGDHHFKPGTEFGQVLSFYIFDRKFRLLVLEAIERIEVSVRTQFAYVMGNRYGSHAYLNTDLFNSKSICGKCLESLQQEFDRSRETFIEHYKKKYTDPALPPIWAACEIMSLGQLSTWFHNIKLRRDRNDIAAVFRIDEKVLVSFLHHLSHIRNLVAHHSRLWNRKLTLTMLIPRRPKEISNFFNPSQERKIYNTLVMLGYMLNVMSPGTTWSLRVRKLLEENGFVNPLDMGFPPRWESLLFWNKKI